MSDCLRLHPASSPEMIAVFSDQSTIRHALAFEAALAQAQAQEGLVGTDIAEEIANICTALIIEPADLAGEAALAGTLAIPLVARLRAELPRDVASHVHHGATSQDLADTVLMIQAREAAHLVLADCERASKALLGLAQRHSATPAAGRTLLQDALPVSFGLRLAQSAAGIDDAARRLASEIDTHARVQFGGAVGTRAGLGGKGQAIADRLAERLGLSSAVPWHTRRVGTAAIATSLGIVIGALAKFARDVALLAQNGIAEAHEPKIRGRGGSSAMAHKRNPTGCQIALTAATRAPGLVAAMLGAMVQEEERGLGNWQAESAVLADLFLIAAGSAAAMAVVAEGLDIDTGAITRNLAQARQGSDIGESEAIIAALCQRLEKS